MLNLGKLSELIAEKMFPFFDGITFRPNLWDMDLMENVLKHGVKRSDVG